MQRSLCLHETTCSGSKDVMGRCLVSARLLCRRFYTHLTLWLPLSYTTLCFICRLRPGFISNASQALFKYQDRTTVTNPLLKTEPYWVRTCFVSWSVLADWCISYQNKITIHFRLVVIAVLHTACKKLNTIIYYSFFNTIYTKNYKFPIV